MCSEFAAMEKCSTNADLNMHLKIFDSFTASNDALRHIFK